MQCLQSANNTEKPPFRLCFAKSGSLHPGNSIVGTLIYDPSSLCLGVQSLGFNWLPCWWIWSEMRFRRYIFTMLKSDSSTRCCAISNLICIWSSSIRRCSTVTPRLFQVGWFCSSFSLYKVCYFIRASKTIIVDLLVQNCLKTSFRQGDCSRKFSMYSIVASVRYQYFTMWWKSAKVFRHYNASVKEMLCLAEGFKRVAANTETLMLLSAFITIPLQCVTWL